MNKGILMGLLIYYALISLFFVFGKGEGMFSDWSDTISLNATNTTDSSASQFSGGIFTTGISFFQYLCFVTFGIGLGTGVPGWFVIMFSMWTICLNIFTMAWLISSVWGGGG